MGGERHLMSDISFKVLCVGLQPQYTGSHAQCTLADLALGGRPSRGQWSTCRRGTHMAEPWRWTGVWGAAVRATTLNVGASDKETPVFDEREDLPWESVWNPD